MDEPSHADDEVVRKTKRGSGLPGADRADVLDLTASVWALAALAVVLRDTNSRPDCGSDRAEVVEASRDVLRSASFALPSGVADGEDGTTDEHLLAHLTATLTQAAALASGPTNEVEPGRRWADSPEATLSAQGARSAAVVEFLIDEILPRVPEMEVALRAGDVPMRFLDVGAGTGQLTHRMLETFDGLHAVALEPEPELRLIAHRTLAVFETDGRAEVSDGRLETLGAANEYDLIWIPLDFIGPPPATTPAIRKAFASLRPGGLLFAAVPSSEATIHASGARLRSAIWRGSVIDSASASADLLAAGFAAITDLRYSRGLRMLCASKPQAGGPVQVRFSEEIE